MYYSLIMVVVNIILQPMDTTVDESEQAFFNCSFSCPSKNTHTMVWLVGNQPHHRRHVIMGYTRGFISTSGLQIEIRGMSSCKNGGAGIYIQQLIINASSAQLYNRTAVQCLAYRKKSTYNDEYSAYGIMLVNSKSKQWR